MTATQQPPSPSLIPIDAVVDLAVLALQFGRVDRVTYHEDGTTPESDTDHTVMLGLVACAVAERVNDRRMRTSYPLLRLGLVAQFALVHDLVEALCGDTNTLRISDASRADKAQREHAALEELHRRFAALPWIAATIDRYETLVDPEARFVKVLDKVLPKLTHALNGGAALREHGVDLAGLGQVNGSQREKIGRSYGADQPEAMALLYAAHEELVKRLTTRPCRREGCGGVVERRFSKGGGRAKVYCSPACYPSKYQRRQGVAMTPTPTPASTKPCPSCGKLMVLVAKGFALMTSPPRYPQLWRCGCGHFEDGPTLRGRDDFMDRWNAANSPGTATPSLRLSPTATLPSYAHDGDAGLDLVADEDVKLYAGCWARVKTNVAMALPRGTVGFVCPRSGMAEKHGVTVLNGSGVVDEGYRGSVDVLLVNLGPRHYEVRRGDKVAQLVVVKAEQLRLEEVAKGEELPLNERGAKGFGSSG